MFGNSSACPEGQTGGILTPWFVPAAFWVVRQRVSVATSNHGNCVISADASVSSSTGRKALNGSEEKEKKF